jgi:hypothetical protein
LDGTPGAGRYWSAASAASSTANATSVGLRTSTPIQSLLPRRITRSSPFNRARSRLTPFLVSRTASSSSPTGFAICLALTQ